MTFPLPPPKGISTAALSPVQMAKPGKKVVVQYVGKLASNGRIFDQTKGNSTFGFRLGVGEVIKGELADPQDSAP